MAAATNPDDEVEAPVFLGEHLKALNATLLRQNQLLREMLDLVRELRDDSATRREHAAQRHSNGDAGG